MRIKYKYVKDALRSLSRMSMCSSLTLQNSVVIFLEYFIKGDNFEHSSLRIKLRSEKPGQLIATPKQSVLYGTAASNK